MGFPGLKSTARGGKKRCYLSGMPLIKSLLEHNSLTIANLCIMEGVFTWHSPGLSVVFCCNVGRREGSPERDQGCSNEVCWGTCMAVPSTQVLWGSWVHRDKSVSEVCKAVAEDLGNA